MLKMSGLNVDQLIRSVKKRPSIYNKNDVYYKQKEVKDEMWKEIAREVIRNWDQLSLYDQNISVTALQKRWKNLRTCFAREVQIQKQNETIQDESKIKKKYGYYDKLRFLLCDEKQNEETEDPLDKDTEYMDEHSIFSDDIPKAHVKIEAVQPECFLQTPLVFDRDEPNKIVLNTGSFNPSRATTDDEDEDRQFMLSLVPSMKKLNDKQKFEARIEILKILQRLNNQNTKMICIDARECK